MRADFPRPATTQGKSARPALACAESRSGDAMSEITKRALLGAGGLAMMAAAPAAASGPEDAFVTKHSGTFNGKRVEYQATVAPTVINGRDGQPAIRFVTIAYTAVGADPARRPVLFAFNGGP